MKYLSREVNGDVVLLTQGTGKKPAAWMFVRETWFADWLEEHNTMLMRMCRLSGIVVYRNRR